MFRILLYLLVSSNIRIIVIIMEVSVKIYPYYIMFTLTFPNFFTDRKSVV